MEQARDLNHEIGDQPEELESDVRIAECLAMQGRASEALELATEALARSETLGGPATPSSNGFRGCALAQLGRLSEAREALEESVAGARGREAEYEEALALQGLARIGAIEGSSDAPELDARYRAIFERLGVVAAPMIPIGKALGPSAPRDRGPGKPTPTAYFLYGSTGSIRMAMWTLVLGRVHSAGLVPGPVVRNCSDTHGVGASTQLARIPTQ